MVFCTPGSRFSTISKDRDHCQVSDSGSTSKHLLRAAVGIHPSGYEESKLSEHKTTPDGGHYLDRNPLLYMY